ncbi:MAG: ABC transporter ATP-binding protein [Alphaproteobacteria bacterium]
MAKRALKEFKYLEDWHNPNKKPYILIDQISKSYSASDMAVNHVSLEIYKGEFFSLLGPSGCGKSTLLRILAGLEKPDSGRILIDGIDMTDYPPYKRPVNMMFQSYALFPHMTVAENVSFGLEQEKLLKSTIKSRVDDILHLLKIEKFADRKPNQLSGGQRQRVALARCLIKKPKLVLLDEPLAALDKKLREHTQFELVNIQEKIGVTFIMVTHDQEEAMTMSTRLGIMEEGRIRQVGTPKEVYEFPNSEYVADFIGTTNLFYGVVLEESSTHTTVQSDELKMPLYINHGGQVAVGSQVAVSLRPEKISIHIKKPKGKQNCAPGIVKDIAYLGDVSIYYIQIEPSKKLVLATLPNFKRSETSPVTWNDRVYISWKPENPVILTA